MTPGSQELTQNTGEEEMVGVKKNNNKISDLFVLG